MTNSNRKTLCGMIGLIILVILVIALIFAVSGYIIIDL